jgi:hypothetical protein
VGVIFATMRQIEDLSAKGEGPIEVIQWPAGEVVFTDGQWKDGVANDCPTRAPPGRDVRGRLLALPPHRQASGERAAVPVLPLRRSARYRIAKRPLPALRRVLGARSTSLRPTARQSERRDPMVANSSHPTLAQGVEAPAARPKPEEPDRIFFQCGGGAVSRRIMPAVQRTGIA